LITHLNIASCIPNYVLETADNRRVYSCWNIFKIEDSLTAMMILKPVAAAALTRSQVEKFDLMQPSNKMLGNTARDYPYFEEVPDSQIISWLGSSLVKAASSNDRRGAGSIRKLKYKRVRATNITSSLHAGLNIVHANNRSH
jgi:hypothetical protein